MIEVINRQRRRKLNAKQWREFGEEALQVISKDEKNAAIVFVADEAIRKLNRSFRGKNYATDVLSFPTVARPRPVRVRRRLHAANSGEQQYLGDIAISPATARRYATSHDRTVASELRVLIVHGVLHLLGYDHETDRGEMDKIERKLRKRFGLTP